MSDIWGMVNCELQIVNCRANEVSGVPHQFINGRVVAKENFIKTNRRRNKKIGAGRIANCGIKVNGMNCGKGLRKNRTMLTAKNSIAEEYGNNLSSTQKSNGKRREKR